MKTLTSPWVTRATLNDIPAAAYSGTAAAERAEMLTTKSIVTIMCDECGEPLPFGEDGPVGSCCDSAEMCNEVFDFDTILGEWVTCLRAPGHMGNHL